MSIIYPEYSKNITSLEFNGKEIKCKCKSCTTVECDNCKSFRKDCNIHNIINNIWRFPSIIDLTLIDFDIDDMSIPSSYVSCLSTLKIINCKNLEEVSIGSLSRFEPHFDVKLNFMAVNCPSLKRVSFEYIDVQSLVFTDCEKLNYFATSKIPYESNFQVTNCPGLNKSSFTEKKGLFIFSSKGSIPKNNKLVELASLLEKINELNKQVLEITKELNA